MLDVLTTRMETKVMHSHKKGRALAAHMTFDEKPITASAICCCCEDGAGNRIGSWTRAKEQPDYDQSSRQTISAGRCAFCGWKGGTKSDRVA